MDVPARITSGYGDVFVIFTWTLFSGAVAQPHRSRTIKTTKHFNIN